jgi:hypothetical protein
MAGQMMEFHAIGKFFTEAAGEKQKKLTSIDSP